jgi:putative PIN family toxin of toxin-antitoxin system
MINVPVPFFPPDKVIRLAREGKIQLIMSPEIIEEIRGVLLYPKIAKRHRRTSEQVDLFLKKLTKAAIITQSGPKFDVIKEDPSDNKYLACAVEGRAEYLISGDRHLINLRTFRGIRITDPAHFLKIVDGKA